MFAVNVSYASNFFIVNKKSLSEEIFFVFASSSFLYSLTGFILATTPFILNNSRKFSNERQGETRSCHEVKRKSSIFALITQFRLISQLSDRQN